MMIEPKKHAKLSASGSHRWLNCAASVALCEKAPPSRESKYAAEGTVAHELLEGILRAHINLSNPFTTLQELRKFHPDKEMVEHVANSYKEIEMRLKDSPGAILLSEEKVDLTHIGPDMFGTVDAAIVDEFGRLQVWDFKYGAGIPVDPEENTQLLYYAMGIAKKFDYNFKDVLIGIIQPRAEHERGPVREWVLSIKELRGWEDKFRDGVEKTKDPLAAFSAGDWCRFCPAKSMCPEISTTALKQAKVDFSPIVSSDVELKEPRPLLSDPKQISNTLKGIKKLEVWIEAFKEETQALMERGLKVDGFKLVKKRSIRRWIDEKETIKAFAYRHSADTFMSEPTLLSPAQVEKRGMNKDLVAILTTNESSGFTMAPESDKRPEVNPMVLDFGEFEEPYPLQDVKIEYTISTIGKEDKMPTKTKTKKKTTKKKVTKKKTTKKSRKK